MTVHKLESGVRDITDIFVAMAKTVISIRGRNNMYGVTTTVEPFLDSLRGE